jgi:cytochrome c peroxidase
LQNARSAVARGQALFNSREFRITGVAGFNDAPDRLAVRGSCSTCHSAPNSGTQSVPRLFNTGVSAAVFRTADMPLYTLRNLATGEIVETSDPGSAMVSGKWRDIGRFKTPGRRAIESRSPFFHNGSATELTDVVRFYDRRFRIGLSPQEIADLTAFLKAL